MRQEQHPEALDLMLASWNESNKDRIRELLHQALHREVHFVDPSVNVRGIDAFEHNVHEVQKRLPGATYSRVSEVDSHTNLYRYHWAIHRQGVLALQGFDVTEVLDGRVVKVIGFFGDLPLNQAL